MSILSQPQVTPDALFALVRFVARTPELAKEPEPIAEIARWMVARPASAPGGEDLARRVRLIHHEAERLGFIEGGRLAVSDPTEDWDAFCDALHVAVLRSEGQEELFEAYAALVVLLENPAIDPTFLRTQDAMSGALRDALPMRGGEDGTRGFNSTKLSAWALWMSAVGLGFGGPSDVAYFLPFPARRLERMAASLRDPELVSETGMSAATFLRWVGDVLPYLDGGSLFRAAASKARLPDKGSQLSYVLSAALRDLDARRVLQLLLPFGDQPGSFKLCPEVERGRAFSHVRLSRGER